MFNYIINLITEPFVFRRTIVGFIRRFKLGSYPLRVRIGAVNRPHYGYCVYHAAGLAKKLGHQRMGIIEFGVAGGNGLRNLEYHAESTAKALAIDIEIFGFDSAKGLPEPQDYRDLPYHWRQGFYAMDQEAIKSKLRKSKLILGNVSDTVPSFFDRFAPPPIGAVFFDLDYFSSTNAALGLFDAKPCHFLPRVFCYFDDVIGGEIELYNDYTGQRASINEFNAKHQNVKLGKAYHLLAKSAPARWYHQIWISHFFEHQDYGSFISNEDQQLRIH